MISATNAILTGLAVSDMLVMLEYLPFSFYLILDNDKQFRINLSENEDYFYAAFNMFHAHITVVFHTISMWLTILLAVWRLLSIR